MAAWILIMFMSTDPSTQSGVGAISAEFNSEKSCLLAGQALAKQARQRRAHINSWGCFQK